jgi:ADP-ribosylglycohydrolase
LATNDLLDSIYGAFFGFLVGDIVGAHVAYKIYNLPEIPAALLMNGGGTYNIGPGQGTDQTEILFSTAYGLIDGGSVYNSDLMARRYLSWLDSKPFNVSAIFILSLLEIRRKNTQ